jgi:hypothetical protein
MMPADGNRVFTFGPLPELVRTRQQQQQVVVVALFAPVASTTGRLAPLLALAEQRNSSLDRIRAARRAPGLKFSRGVGAQRPPPKHKSQCANQTNPIIIWCDLLECRPLFGPILLHTDRTGQHGERHEQRRREVFSVSAATCAVSRPSARL